MSSKDSSLKRDLSRFSHSATIKDLTNENNKLSFVKSNLTKLPPAKPSQDFSSRADGVGKIKERTLKLYEDRFAEIKAAQKIANRDDEVLLSGLQINSNYNTLPDMKSSDQSRQINEQDIFVTRKSQYGIFPVADFKYFPARKPDALGWQVGLRSYFRHNEKHAAIVNETENVDEISTIALSTTESGTNKLTLSLPVLGSTQSSMVDERLVRQWQQSSDNVGRLMRQSSTTLLTEQKKSQYSIEELPALQPEVQAKYFEEQAKDNFYATYAQLRRRGEILSGGYEEQRAALLLPEGSDVMENSVAFLRQHGVISPREVVRGEEKRGESFSASLSSVSIEENAEQNVFEEVGEVVVDPPDDADPGVTCPSRSSAPPPPRLDLSDRSYIDSSLDRHHGAASPRAIFLNGCLLNNIPPITTALIRKKLSSTINLSHMGLGNKMALILAPCISAMPYLQVLNLTDNNLQDSGLAALIVSIAKHPDIEMLDISQNVIGSDAADALASFIGTPDCRLQCLRMSDANIDDGECARFVEVLMNNIHLKELDMSKNLLGKDENLNAVQPDFVTGGESLSELIRNESCPIQILNLHWNMIRLEGAEVLCDSIRTNRTLTNLDLSYNALGRSAAEVLGAALMENNTIREINIANNGIDAIGCFALCIGVRENRSLHFLNLDGNPLGESGGRILMKVAASDGHRLTISAKNCDVTVRSSEVKFDINDPCGVYEFNLGRSYERCCVLEILDIVAADPTVEVGVFEYSESGSKGPFAPLKITKFKEKRLEVSGREEKERLVLESMREINNIPHKLIFSTTQKYDMDGSEMVKLSHVPKIFRELRIEYTSDFLAEIKFALDTREAGLIDINEFVEYVTKRGQMAVDRIHDLTHRVWCAVATEPRTRFVPPSQGVVRIRLLEGYNTSNEFKSAPISHTKVLQVIQTANLSSNPLSLLLYSLDSAVVYLEEAKLYFQEISSKTEDSVAALAKILLHMHCAGDAMRLIKSFVGNDILRVRRLKQVLGSAYYPLIGIYSGYYSLDLSNEQDRICLKKLIERSIENELIRKAARLWDTSQHGNWNCFRNEVHRSKNGPPDMCISPRCYFPIPRHGKVEFDFVNTERPDPRSCKPEHEDRFIDFLLLSRLLDEDHIDLCVSRLAEMSIACRKAFISNGSPCWKAELARGLQVGDSLYYMYCNLNSRRASLEKAAKKEVVKSATPTAKKDDKRKGDSKNSNRSSMFNKKQAEVKSAAAAAFATNGKSKENITKFRSIVNRGNAQFTVSPWKRRLFEVMLDTKGATDEFKSNALLEYFEAELTHVWLYCKYVAVLLDLFRMGVAHKSSMGSYRVQLLVMVFDRIVDLHNFELVLMVLNAEEHACVLARIGVLNIFNPSKPEGAYQLDLSRWDERQVVKMLMHLSVVEPGENWANKNFIFDHGFNANPGWDLTVTWFTEGGLPLKGILSFEMFAGDGLNLMGCLVDQRLRNILSALVLVPQRDMSVEIEGEAMLTVELPTATTSNKKGDAESALPTHPKNHPKPTLPVLKLITQCDVFPFLRKKSASDAPSAKYTVDDANAHLVGTDLNWNYTSTIQKTDVWQLQ